MNVNVQLSAVNKEFVSFCFSIKSAHATIVMEIGGTCILLNSYSINLINPCVAFKFHLAVFRG